MNPPRRRMMYAALLAAAASYAGALHGVFQFDDHNVIVNEPSVHSLSAWLADLPGGIRPLLKLSYALNWSFDPRPVGFLLVNVLLHTANTALAYLLAWRFCDRIPALRESAGNVAVLSALLFALHPVQTEAVAYISGRSMSLMALFYLGSLLAYAQGAEEGRPMLRSLLSPLLFIAALLVRETALTLPVALLLWELADERPSSLKAALRSQAVHWIVLCSIILVLFAHPGYRGLLAFSFGIRDTGATLLAQVSGLLYLFSRFVLVHRLNIDPAIVVPDAWTPLLALAAAVLVSLPLVAVLLFRRRPWLGFGILWLFLHLLPTNSIVPRLDIANERHLYLAGWALFLALSAEAALFLERAPSYRPAALAVLFVMLIVLTAVTVQRTIVYRSEAALWEDSVAKNPLNPRAHNNLGYAYFQLNRRDNAVREYEEAVRLRPGYEVARRNLSAAQAGQP